MKDHRKLPVEPLDAWIERRGGLMQAMEQAGKVCYVEETGRNTTEYNTTHQYLMRARTRGWADAFWLDEFIIDTFGVHPCQVYGELWFIKAAEDTEDYTAPPAAPAAVAA